MTAEALDQNNQTMVSAIPWYWVCALGLRRLDRRRTQSATFNGTKVSPIRSSNCFFSRSLS